MDLVIASDHAGFKAKKDIVEYLKRNHLNWKIKDMGPDDDNAVDYPIYAHRVAAAVSKGEARRGILICGTGLGMSMMANRFQGVRAAVCTTAAMAITSREHNRSNILCLSARTVTLEENLDIINKWAETKFVDHERHLRRIQLMDLLEIR